MPIKGVSDRVRLPRKGILRIGEKVKGKNGKEYPKALDHFVGPEEFHKFFGAEPKEIQILFPFNTVFENYDESLKAYKSGGKLFCKGDGQTASRSDGKGGMIELDCPHTECEYFQKKECKQIGVLTFLIPELSITGAYQIWTSSRSSMDNIRSTLIQLELMFGKLSGIPMTVKVKMEKANPWMMKDGKKVQISTIVPILCVECNLPMETVQRLAARKNFALGSGTTTPETDTYPDTLYPPEHHVQDGEVSDAVPEEFPTIVDDDPTNGSVKKFMNYCQYLEMEELCKEPIVEFMSVTDKKGEIRCPTNDQILKWESENEIAFVNKAIEKMELKFPILVEKFQ